MAWLLHLCPIEEVLVYAHRHLQLARVIGSAILCLLAAAGRPHAQTAQESLVQQALQNNPSLKAQRSRVQAALQSVPQAGALPDPAADLEFMNISLSHPSLKDALTKSVSVGVVQTLPFPGKRALSKQAASDMVAAEQARLAQMEQKIRSELLSTLFEYALGLKLLEINQKTQDSLQIVVQSTLATYSAGRGDQADILMAQTSLTKAQAEQLTLRSSQQIALARLSSLVARPVDEKEIACIEAPEPSRLPSLAELQSSIEDTSPDVLVAKAEAGLAATKTEAARAAFKPDFLVGGRYRHDDMTMGGGDYLTASVGMTLPFFHRKDRYKPALEEALYRQQGASEEVQSSLTQVRYRLSEAYQRATRDASMYVIYTQGLLLQAAEAHSAELTAYSMGRGTFTDVISTLANLYTYEADAASARAEFQEMVVEMEGILGHPIPLAPPTPPPMMGRPRR